MNNFSEMASTHGTGYEVMQLCQRAAPLQKQKQVFTTSVQGESSVRRRALSPAVTLEKESIDGIPQYLDADDLTNISTIYTDSSSLCESPPHVAQHLMLHTQHPSDEYSDLSYSSHEEELSFCANEKEVSRNKHDKRSEIHKELSRQYELERSKKDWNKSLRRRFARKVMHPQSGVEPLLANMHPLAQKCLNKLDIIVAQLYIVSRLGDDLPARIVAIHALVRALFPNETDLSHVYSLFSSIVAPVLPQSGPSSWAGSLREILVDWKLFKSHPLGGSFSTLLSACALLGIIGPGKFKFSIGDLELFSKSIHKKHVSAVDVFDALMETIIYFFEVGHAILTTRSLSPLLFATDRADELAKEVSFLKANAAFASNGTLPTIDPTCSINDYSERLRECLDRVSDSITTLEKGSYERYLLLRKREELEGIQSKFLASQAASCQRLRPYAGMVCASSGVGKTTFVRDSVVYMLAANGFESDDSKIITVSDTDKYDSTLRSDVEAIIDDDVANQKPKFAPFSAASRIINIVNSKPYAANMAAVEDKGKVSCNAKIYFASTNHACLDAYETSNCPSSVLCRFQIAVTLEVKSEFCSDGDIGLDGMQLDSRKVFDKLHTEDCDFQPHHLDVWNITVKRPFVVANARGRTEKIGYKLAEFEGKNMEDVDYATYLRFICHDSKAYFENQRRLLARSLDVTSRISKCCHGVPTIATCALCSVADDDSMPELEDEESVVDDTFSVQSGALIGSTLGWFLRSWFNTSTRKLYATCLGEVRELEHASTCVLLSFCKDWRNSVLNSWTDYIPDSFIDTYIGRYVVKRAVRARSARTILLVRMIHLFYLAISARYIQQRRRLWMLVPFPAAVAALSYKCFVCAIDHSFEKKLLARRDLLQESAREIRDQYLSRAIKFIGATGLIYTTFCVMREFMKAGREVTSGVAFAPFGFTREADAPLTVRVLDREAGVLSQQQIQLPSSTRILDSCVASLKPSFEPHGNLMPTTQEEILARNLESNHYKRVHVEPMGGDDRVKCSTIDDVISRLHKHQIHFSIEYNNEWRVCNALVVAPRVVIIPLHILTPTLISKTSHVFKQFRYRVIRRDPDTVGGSFENIAFAADLFPIPSTDFCLIHLPSIGDARNLAYLFPEAPGFSGPVKLTYKNNRGQLISYDATVTDIGDVDHAGCERFRGGFSHVPSGTFNGLCIAPYVSLGKAPFVVGLHLGGHEGASRGVYGCLTSSQLLKGLEQLAALAGTSFHVQSGTIPAYIMGEQVVTSYTVHSKSVVNFMDQSCDVRIFGSCPGKATFRPSIVTSMISSAVAQHCGVEQKWGNPSTHPWKFERKFLANAGNPATKMDTDALAWAKEDWTRPIVTWAKRVKQRYQKLSLIETVSGRDGSRWIDALNKTSAVGFPLSGSKKNFLVALDPLEWPEWNCPYTLGPELLDERERILDCYSRSERAYPIFKSCPKSEAIALSKDKKRLFQVAPTAYQTVVRQYFLGVAVLLSQCPLLSECSVGINCASPEWDQMISNFEVFPSSQCIAGDYKDYDQRMSPDVTRAAWTCVIDIARSLGASDADVHIMECIVSDMVSPVLAMEGTLIQLNASNPSGQNLTAHMNCVINSLLLRCVWFLNERSYGRVPRPFRDHVALQVYGDDNLATTDEPTYSMVTISEKLGAFGYVYTDAQKSDTLVPFIHLDNAEYLKRSTVFHPLLQCRVGALVQDSIFKSLHCFDMRSKVSKHEHAISVVDGAAFEFFLHGEEVYERRRLELIKVLSDCGLVSPNLDLDYTTRAVQWLETHSPLDLDTVARRPQAVQRNDAPHIPKAAGFAHMGLLRRDTREPGNCTKNNSTVEADSTTCGLAHLLNEQESDDSHPFEQQSGIEALNVGSVSNNTWHQTTQFADGTPGSEYVVESTLGASTISGDAQELTLSQFFARPVLISSFQWTYDSAAFGIDLNPWALYFSQPQVTNRITNFARLRATLKLKILITGNGFYYGRMMVVYSPLPFSDELTLSRPVFEADLVEASQRPHIFLDPSTSEGGEMELPFFWPREALSIPGSEWDQMGFLQFFDMAALKHASGSTAPVTISVFAWSDNVELSIPTTKNASTLLPQSGTMTKSGASDEYGKSIISKPASALANIAGRLVNAPVIGPYARATQIASGGIASLATMFGYSRPNAIANIPKNQLCYHINYANTDAESLAYKLSLDSKQEVTVDTRVMGLAGHDEMSIKNVATRMTYLTNFDWLVNKQPGDVLFRSGVHPGMYNIIETEALTEYHLTAMANMQELFTYWRGTIKFRFQIVASAFHRGRLRITWDPVYAGGSSPYNIAYNYVVDIAEERDFVIEVGWGSTSGMLRTYPISQQPRPFSFGTFSEPTDSPPPGWNSAWSNGALRVDVLNALTLPSDVVADISVNVFVCTGDDIEFAAPTSSELRAFTPLRPQSGTEMISPDHNSQPEDNTPLKSDTVAVFATPPGDMEKALQTYSGEVIVSLRTLLKRVSMQSFYTALAFSTTALHRTSMTLATYPPLPGFDPYAVTSSAAGAKYNYVNMIPLQWVMLSYMGYRGSIRVAAIRTGANSGSHYLGRVDPDSGGFRNTGNTLSSAPAQLSRNYSIATAKHCAGTAGNNPATAIILEAEIPWQYNIRFLPCKRKDQLNPTPGPFQYHTYDFFGVNSSVASGVSYGYSTGEDFQLGFYVGLPVMYLRVDPAP